MLAQNLNQLLNEKIAAAKYPISVSAQEQLFNYLLLLAKWNQTYNLTSVRDVEEMIPLHILDSLAITPFLYGKRILDVGTGAGLPGIPLAITQPERNFVLLDSNGKKTRFLTHVLQQLNLPNVEVVQARVEQYQVENKFDVIVSRAFSDICDFVQKTQHLLADNGQFFAMKGQYPQEELGQLPIKFKLLAEHELQIPGLTAQRHLICLKLAK